MNSNQIMRMIDCTTDDYYLKKIDLSVFVAIMRSYYPVINAMRELSDGQSTNRRRLINYVDAKIETAKTFDGTWVSNDVETCCNTCKNSYAILNASLTGCNVRSGRLLPSERICCNWCAKECL